VIELRTSRLLLRELRGADAPFILQLLNDPDFLRYIGDRNVRTLEQAQAYIVNGPLKSYSEFGYGLLLTLLRSSDTPLGLCGLVQRDYLPDPDIGFAFLPQFRAQGFCTEASLAVLNDATANRKFKRIAAIVQPDNAASLGLLKKLGFIVDRPFKRSINDQELLVLALSA
jgi:RimJ/RimL family protein N-acetyltransferase